MKTFHRRDDLFGLHPVVVGHRGTGRGLSPDGCFENTVGAFLRAAELGAGWVECDAQVGPDGTVVLAHDLIGHDAPALCHWVSLDALHRALPAHIGIDVDVKVGLPDAFGDDRSTHKVLTYVRAHLGERPWLVSSFDPTVVLEARRLGLPAGWVTTEGWSAYGAVATSVRLGAQAACVHAATLLTEDPTHPGLDAVMESARSHGLAVMAWDVLPEQITALREVGVSAFCVDDITGTLQALRGASALDGLTVSVR